MILIYCNVIFVHFTVANGAGHLLNGSAGHSREHALAESKKFGIRVIKVKTDINNLTNNQEKIFKNSDCVFHLAGLADIVPSILNPEKYFKANVNGTLKILEISKKYKVKKLIYAASASCYGIPKKYPTSEKDVLDLQYPYAITKKIGEDLVLKWAKIYKMNNSSLRFFNLSSSK